ncbi:MAG TPA: RNA polymerase sigma factor [Rectinemataceae bacterium]|nr:RNA polymerase sigma factor [Rectinemataceae bacterium]
MTGDARNDDDEVVARVLSGDREAYRFLVDRYGNRVVAFCRSRMKSDEDARDAAQDVFVRAFGSLASFRQGESFPAWLFAIAGNHVRTRFRLFSSERRKTEAAGIVAATAAPTDPTEDVERTLNGELLRRAVSALPVELRWPVEFYYFAELSVAETARVLGLGEEAVKTRLFRARKALRHLLEGKQPKSGSRGITL